MQYLLKLVGTVGGALDSDGNFFPLDSLQQTINKNVDGTIDYIEATDGTVTYWQSFSYPDAVTTTISQWVKQ